MSELRETAGHVTVKQNSPEAVHRFVALGSVANSPGLPVGQLGVFGSPYERGIQRSQRGNSVRIGSTAHRCSNIDEICATAAALPRNYHDKR
jgi:hypothetical protein